MRKTRHVFEVRLVGEGRVSKTVVIADLHRVVEDAPQAPGFRQRLGFAVPALPPPILIHHQADARVGGGLNDRLGVFPALGQRLLQQYRQTLRGYAPRKVEVRRGASSDVDEIRLAIRDHAVEIRT